MRRRWKAVVAVGAALFGGLLFLMPQRDNGLDWIRRYGVTEIVGTPKGFGTYYFQGHPQSTVTAHTFYFEKVPAEVLAYVKAQPKKLWGPTVDSHSGEVVIYVVQKPSWLESQWSWLKHYLS